MPKSICDDCATRLEDAYNFRNMYERSEESLRKLLNLPLEDKSTEVSNITILAQNAETIVGDSFTNKSVIENTSSTETDLAPLSVEDKMKEMFEKETVKKEEDYNITNNVKNVQNSNLEDNGDSE